MPPKRKAASGNKSDASSSKVAKSSTNANPNSDAQAKTANKDRSVKSSNPDTLSKKPAYVILDWQSTDYANHDDDKDETEDEGDDENNGEKNDDDGQFAPNAWDGKGKSAKEEDLDLPEPGEKLGENGSPGSPI
ncbi:hypothetical protein BPAE_0182g00020 [Botrytis paeoniae]|uniref:Uncharacterized protein n=1 Tax=Botrytis paeoniae TaxID=278948 RepID=A0A4Z1FC40_9HELO|nr:hypothetical protein BPAE_0182g00020 [Botrytis paeoniae]